MSDPVNDLLTAMTSDDPQMRETAVRALGTYLGASRYTEAMADELDAHNPRLTVAYQMMAAALDDPDWGVRQSAAEMAIRLNTTRAAAGLDRLLHDLTNDDPEIRLGAAWSLALLKDPRAVDALVRLLYQNDPILVASAADALGETGDQRAIPALVNLIDHPDEDVREAARDAIERLQTD
ncbi:MAG: HEAT repeat domain-containing protein [bacterium]|nr:HEAT repeat domain-containing protein [bacterium]